MNSESTRRLLDDLFADTTLDQVAAEAWTANGQEAELQRVAGLGELTRDVLDPGPEPAATAWAKHQSPQPKPRSKRLLLSAIGTASILGLLLFFLLRPPSTGTIVDPVPIVAQPPPNPAPPQNSLTAANRPSLLNIVSERPKLLVISHSKPALLTKIGTEDLDKVFGDTPWMLVCGPEACTVWMDNRLAYSTD